MLGSDRTRTIILVMVLGKVRLVGWLYFIDMQWDGLVKRVHGVLAHVDTIFVGPSRILEL